MGIATLYLFFNQDRFDKLSGPVEELLRHSNKIKDSITVFIEALILTWAGMQ